LNLYAPDRVIPKPVPILSYLKGRGKPDLERGAGPALQNE